MMVTDTRKTSTITIHHDRCDVGKWTMTDWQTLASFVKNANLQSAAALSRLGMQLVTSEHHTALGGTLEEVGFAIPNSSEFTEDVGEIADDGEVKPVQRVYLGPVEYVIPVPMGDGDGNFEGYEFEFKPTESEADSLRDEIMDHAGARRRSARIGCTPARGADSDFERRCYMGMTFGQFSEANRSRCESAQGFNHPLNAWNTSDWMLALTGELGEAANVAKKLNRARDGIAGNKQSVEELRNQLRKELGDVFVYLDLTAQSLGFSIADAAAEVFNAKSAEIGYPVKL